MDPIKEWQSRSSEHETATVSSAATTTVTTTAAAAAAAAAAANTSSSAYVKRRRRLNANGKIVQRTRNSKKCLVGQPRRNPLRSVAAARKESLLLANAASKRMTRKRLLNNNNNNNNINNVNNSNSCAPVKRRKRRRRSDATTAAATRDSCSENDVDDEHRADLDAKSYGFIGGNGIEHSSGNIGVATQSLAESSSTSSISTRSSFNIGATLDAPTSKDEIEWKEWPSHGMHERPVYHPQFGLATEHNGRYFVNRPDAKGYEEVRIDAKPCIAKFASSSSRRQVATAIAATTASANATSAKSSHVANARKASGESIATATVTATIATGSRRQRAADGSLTTTRPTTAIAYVAPSQQLQQQQQQQKIKQPIVLSSLDRSKVMAYLAQHHQLLQSNNLSRQRKLELLQQRLNSRPRLLQVQLSKNKNVAAVLQAAAAAAAAAATTAKQSTATVTGAAAATTTTPAVATVAAAAVNSGKVVSAAAACPTATHHQARIITQDMLRSWREANQQKQHQQHQAPGKILLMPSRPLQQQHHQQQQQQQQQQQASSNTAVGAPLTMPFCGVPALNGNGKLFFVRAPDLAKKLKTSEKSFTVTSTSSPSSLSSSAPALLSHQHHQHHQHTHPHTHHSHHHHHHHPHHHHHHPVATTTTTTKRMAAMMPWATDANLLVRKPMTEPHRVVPKLQQQQQQQQQQTFPTISPSEATILLPKSCGNNFAYSQPYYVLDLSKKETTHSNDSGNSNGSSSNSGTADSRPNDVLFAREPTTDLVRYFQSFNAEESPEGAEDRKKFARQ